MKFNLALSLLALSTIPCQAAPNIIKGVGKEVKQTTIDLVTWKHPAWNLMVLAQLGGDLVDAKTTADAQKRGGIEANEWLYGRHPDFKTVALIDIGESALIGTGSHWLHTHSPRPYIKTADYWWLIPQTIDIVMNSHDAYHNTHVNTTACIDPDHDCERLPDIDKR